MEQNKNTFIFSMLLIITLLAACSPPASFPPTGSQPTQSQAPEAIPTEAATEAAATGAPTAPAGDASVTEGSPCLNVYYPVRQGATWNYTSTGGPAGEYSFTDTITSVREDGFTLATQIGGVARTQEWACQADGLLALQFGGAPAAMLNAQNIELNFDASNASGMTFPRDIDPGSQWQHSLDYQGNVSISGEQGQAAGTAQTSFTALGHESVTVPAGTFEAIKVQADTTLDMTVNYAGVSLPAAFTTSYTFWFVQGVGWVKSAGTGTLMGTTFSETTELQTYLIP